MLNANILKLSHHRFDAPEKKPRERKAAKSLLPAGQFAENLLLDQDNVERLLQNSGNVITHIADITLLEVPAGDVARPITDGFGNEDDQMLSLFMGPEEMRQAQDKSSVLGDISNMETSKLQVSIETPVQVERAFMEEQPNVTMAPDNRSLPTVPEIEIDLVADTEKALNIVNIPEEEDVDKREILPVPKVAHSTPLQAEDKQVKTAKKRSPIAEKIADETLESLQPVRPAVKRRRKASKLIVDTQITLDTAYMMSRLEPRTDIACEFQDAPIKIDCVLPPEQYFNRPAHSFSSNRRLALSSHYIHNFQRNLVAIKKKSFEEREREFILAGAEADKQLAQESSIEEADTTNTMARVKPVSSHKRAHRFMEQKEEQELHVFHLVDIGNLPTQMPHGDPEIAADEVTRPAIKISKSQTIRCRSRFSETEGLEYEQESIRPAKTARLELGGNTAEDPQEGSSQIAQVHQKSHPTEVLHHTPSPPLESHNQSSINNAPSEQTVNKLLVEAGLADRPVVRAGRSDTDSTETQLGSLDRTPVSLGDSVATTDSRRFLREEWGSEATLLRIITELNRCSQPVTLNSLLASGPQHPHGERRVATACFNSLLKLKQANFINITKQDDSTAIKFIQLGPLISEEEFL